MKRDKTAGLGRIRLGELVYYIPLKFDTKLNFTSLCNQIISVVEKDFDTCGEQIQANVANHACNSSSPGCVSHGTSLILNSTGDNLSLEMHLGCMKAYLAREKQFDSEEQEYKKFYGHSFVSMQQRIILPPMQIELYSGNLVWLNVILIVFTNKMGFLKLELPLEDVSAEFLKAANHNAYISSAIGGCVLPKKTSNISFEEIHDLYLTKLLSIKGVKQIFSGASIFNIILADCEGTPKHIEDIPIPVQKDLYEIIAAPIGEREHFSTTEDAEEYLKAHSWGKHLFKSFTSTTGGCLSLIDRGISNQRISACASKIGASSLNDEEKAFVYRTLIKSACINTEFSLSILALKKMNAEYIFQEKLLGYREIHNIQEEYNATLILIAELQSACMGTVHEQLHAFEEMMPYYVNADLAETKMSALDHCQTNRIVLMRERNQSFLSLLSVVLTAIFGLPAIRETITLLCTVFFPFHPDIPYISINSASITLWGFLLVFLVVYFINTLHKRQ